MPSIEELRILQALPLSLKVRRSQQRIREWVAYYGADGVYVSFSGGKDSTVLLHLVRELYPGIPAVFVNTGLEYPEIQRFVRTFDNVEILRPKLSFPEVITKYGYPFISKQTASIVYYGRKGSAWALEMLNNTRVYGTSLSRYNIPKYKPLLSTDFVISNDCCAVMKKHPIKKYARDYQRHPITGMLAEESDRRVTAWVAHGCNAFKSNCPISNPMAFWTEQDVLWFIKSEGIPIASVYGEILTRGDDGFLYEPVLPGCKLCTTGCQRTGCIFCGFGAHLEKESRFERLKKTHPRQYDYCMGGGAYGEDGIWRPSKEGLGMAHVIDELCRLYGPGFIKY